jgi:hypothetical protein
MSNTQNSISAIIAQLMRLEKNSLELLSKLASAATSDNETIDIELIDENKVTSTITVPSFKFLQRELKRIEENQKQLAGLGDNTAILRLSDGSLKKIIEASISKDPKAVSGIKVPSTFGVRNNWFFESFLNPLLYVSLDLSSLVGPDVNSALVKRVIFSTDTEAKKAFFDTTYKNKNDLDYNTILSDGAKQGITLFFDEQTVDLPASTVKFKGNFDVVNVVDQIVNEVVGSTKVPTKKRKYILDKLTYTDVTTGVIDGLSVNKGDLLIRGESKYEIQSVDKSDNSVILRRISGNDPVMIGVDIFTIYSNPLSSKNLQINVGFDERQIIFLKPIDSKFNVAASEWSKGVGIFTNELTTTTTDGLTNLSAFYSSNVTDFGIQFLNAAKEKSIPSLLGILPSSPVVDASNFKVLVVNAHKKDTKEADAIKKKFANKVSIENEINQLDNAINNKKNELDDSTSISPTNRKKLKADLEALAREKSSKVTLYSSIVKELSTKAKEAGITTDSKFKVRGFWPIPSPKLNEKTGPQSVIQFTVAYRYLRKDGNTAGTDQIDFKDVDGSTKRGYFSNWIEVKSEIRKKTYDSTKGVYIWADENVQDPEATNINQLDISISKGEKVEIKIKSISEAGWPINPLESEYSTPIIVDFPDELNVADEGALLQEAAQEETRVKFQEELNARGLDLHLSSAFTSNDKYYAHDAIDISSGFFNNGVVINMFEKLKSIDDELRRLKDLIEKAKGSISISIVDESGNVIKILPNSTTHLFAGFYKELIKSGSGNSITYEHGKVINKVYSLKIENSAASPLELSSYVPGGISEQVKTTDVNRRYENVPIGLTSIINPKVGSLAQGPAFQSSQVKSQVLYLRNKSVGLDEDLYITDSVIVSAPHLTPIIGDSTTGIQDINAWTGDVDSLTSVGIGNGYLSEFTIHKDHPGITAKYNNGTTVDMLVPLTNDGTIKNYPNFIHALYFNQDSSAVDGKKQLGYFTPALAAPLATTATLLNIPAKLGFIKNDEFLIGKNTCGSYLFPAPLNHNYLAVDGSNELAKKIVEFGENKGLIIPIIFQFRCSDKLGYVGGYRFKNPITNISYTKKIGLDIQVRGESFFSFDIEVTCKYEQDSLSSPIDASYKKQI